MLIGSRLGLEIEGFNLPGHFLARAFIDGKPYLFDCFNRGKTLSKKDLADFSLSPRFDFHELLEKPPSAIDIVTRVLINLINGYYRQGALDPLRLAQELLSDLRRELGDSRPDYRGSQAVFEPGQLVRHKAYGYRGEEVDSDPLCRADETWYKANRTQPERQQPWYHVLVDGSSVTTYAAQSNLGPDLHHREIKHPLIPLYFNAFSNGRYKRNDIPWTSF
jgi:heat shock protein HspQ